MTDVSSVSIDPDIQFGDLEQDQPDVELRPDRNAHFAVVPYEEPQPDELPIFVDLDTLIEMESHALTDTSVELGGVMIGGQLHDENGQPYVLVQDSVRAQHYEATKGSFKFTHDTWGQITRERDDFPDDWDMVGWYHTHPDWGVFLSGMDMFICDNFFNKPLDVALVIDPCRQDRAFFQWTGDPRERKRRVGGFYVIASRHRQAELEQFVAELEEGYTMRTDPNVRAGYGVSGGGGAPTVVNITEQRPGWMGQAIVGMLFVQTLMLFLFAYVAIAPRGVEENAELSAAKLEQRERDIALKTSVLDDVLERVADEKGVVSKLQEKEAQVAELQDVALLTKAALPQLKADLDKSESDLEKANKAIDGWKKSDARKSADIKELEAKLEAADVDEDTAAEPKPWYAFFTTTPGITILTVLLFFVGAVSFVAMKTYGAQDQFPEEGFDAPPPGDQPEGHDQDAAPPGEDEAFRMDGEGDHPVDEPPRDDPPRG